MKKGIFTGFLTVIFLLTNFAVVFINAGASADNIDLFVYGDADKTGIVDANDALLILQISAKLKESSKDLLICSDVDGNGDVTANDALLVLQKAAGIIERFPIEDFNTELPDTERPTETTIVETATPVPSGTETTIPPTQTKTPQPTETPICIFPTRIPTATPCPTPTAPPLTFDPSQVIEGNNIEVLNANGTVYSPDKDEYTFTEGQTKGISIKNPIVNNTVMMEDYGYLRDIKVEGKENCFDLAASVLGWGRDENKPTVAEGQTKWDIADLRIYNAPDLNTVNYIKPENKVGFSLSFWAMTTKEGDDSALVAFGNPVYSIVVTTRGSVRYVNETLSSDYLNNERDIDVTANEWHYYTITFSNAWITVYIDGYEAIFTKVDIDRTKMFSFNDGFLTKYNPAITYTQEEYDSDWRGYWKGTYSSDENNTGILTDKKYTVFGAQRYLGKGSGGKLMLKFITYDDTLVYLGGGPLDNSSGLAKYDKASGTKLAQPKYYLIQLTPENVFANYKVAKKPQ